MILEDKIKIIQDLQCKHSQGLAAFDAGLSFGLCVETRMENNIKANYLIKTLYRYESFPLAVTNADAVTINIASTDLTETYSISISYGATNLVTFEGTGTEDSILDQLVTLINTGTVMHTYVCVRVGNVLYLYTHALSATYADAPTITFSELNGLTTELNITPSPLLETQLSPILDSMNCLTSEHLCAIITETKSLLGDCNC